MANQFASGASLHYKVSHISNATSYLCRSSTIAVKGICVAHFHTVIEFLICVLFLRPTQLENT